MHKTTAAVISGAVVAIATAGVIVAGGEVAEIEPLETAIGGVIATLFVLFGPKNET